MGVGTSTIRLRSIKSSLPSLYPLRHSCEKIFRAFSHFSVLEATESLAGPGIEASGMLDLCVFKAGVEQEVAFSQQLLLLPLKQNIFFRSISCYREQRLWGQALKLQYDSINPLSCVALSHMYRKEEGVIFIWLFSSQNFFPTEVFFKITHGCAGHMPKIDFFIWLTPLQLVDPMHACCTHLVHIVCTLWTLSLVAALTQLLHHCTQVVLRFCMVHA